MAIQRADIVLIALGTVLGAVGMWVFVAPDWRAALIGGVCGAAGGTVAAMRLR